MAEGEAKIRISAVNATKGAFDEIKRSMADVEQAGALLRTSLGAIGVGLSVTGIAAFVKSGIDAADQLNKMSQKVGVSVESLSAFQYAAQLSDLSSEQLAGGLEKLARSADAAQSGAGDAAGAFEKLGVRVKNADGSLRGTEELLLDVAERFSQLEDGSQKTALAMQLFGKSGAEMIPFLNQGREGMEALRKEAEKLGLILDRETARAAEEFNDNLTRLGKQTDALKVALVGGLIDPLGRVAESMAKASREGGTLRGILAGIQTLLTGDDAHKFNVELTQTVDALFAQQKKLEEMKASKLFSPGEIEAQAKAVAKLREEANRLVAIKPIIAPDAVQAGERKGKVAGGAGDDGRLAALTAFSSELARLNKLAEEELRRLDATNKKALDEYIRQVDVRAQALKELEDASGEALRAQDRQKQADIAAAAAIRKELDPTIELAEKTREIADLVNKGFLGSEEGDRALEKISSEFQVANDRARGLTDEIKKNDDAARQLGLTFSSAFEDAFVSGKKFSDVLKSIGNDIARMILRKGVTEPAANAVSKAFDGFSLSKLFGGGNSGGSSGSGDVVDILSEFFPARAAGGPVSPGQSYLVGENGPEILRMGAAGGNIIPNGDLRSGSGGFTFAPVIHFAANTPAAVRDAVLAMVPTLNRAAVAAVRESSRR